MDELTVASLIFGFTYLVIVSERIHRTAAALAGGVAMILLRIIDQEEAFAAIDFNVIFLLVGMRDIEDVEESSRISRARTAGELMEEAAYVTMDDTVREAFSRMHERKLSGLPIVDEGMKVLGYLDLLQLLRLWLSRHGRREA